MFDTINLWMDKGELSGTNPFDAQPYLSDLTERQNKYGYSCTGNVGSYHVNIAENGISLKGSLPKYYFGDNLHTLQRKDVQFALEQLSDNLHIDINNAKVTRLDVSTVIPTKRPPADYFPYLGQKPYFSRLLSTPDTLYYNNHQRQIIFYDKVKEAHSTGMVIPEIWQNCNLFRYELRYTKRLNNQLKTDLTACKLYETEFYRAVIENWHKEFKSIQKIKNQSFMTDDIKTLKEAKDWLFADLLQRAGQPYIDRYLKELKAKKVFNNRQRYYELKRRLNTISQAPKGEQSDLVKELETYIFDVARYAR